MEVFFSCVESLKRWDLTSDKIDDLGLQNLGEYEITPEGIEFPVFYWDGAKFQASNQLEETACFAIFPDDTTIMNKDKDRYYEKLNTFFKSSLHIVVVYLHRFPEKAKLYESNTNIAFIQNEDILHASEDHSPFYELFSFVLGHSPYESPGRSRIIKRINKMIEDKNISKIPDCYHVAVGKSRIMKANEVLQESIPNEDKIIQIDQILKDY